MSKTGSNPQTAPPVIPEAEYGPGDRIAVLLPLPLAGAYDYRVAESMVLTAGDFVRVPVRGRELVGVVWGGGTKRGDDGWVDDARVKTVVSRMSAPSMPAPMRRLVDWVASYTVHPAGAVLKMAMSVPEALEPPKPVTAYAANPDAPETRATSEAPKFRMTPTRARVMAALEGGPPRLASELAKDAGCGVSVVRGLVEAGVLIGVDVSSSPSRAEPDPNLPGPTLSPEQGEAAAVLCDNVTEGGFSVAVIDGVPGSGKTEVYFEAVAETLRRGEQVLVLLPEIALGSQWLARFEARFGAAPAEWHSDLSPAQRRDTWRAVSEGRVPVVVGARSALFLPFPDLKLIVVDEEHDAAFKQEDGVIYNARDMAVVRAHLGEFPIVLASATPSLETVVNVTEGRYRGLSLPDRHGGAALPDVDLIDLRRDPPSRGQWLSPALKEAIETTVGKQEQAMLFLNRRGYAPLTLCRTCGHRLQCPRCTAWLVEHRYGPHAGRLQCHHCGYSSTLPKACPECEAEDSFAACGPGVERLAEEVAIAYPDLRTVVAASDTLGSPRAAAELVRRIEDHEVDLVIGTQIVAKGYHFPKLTLVGVVDGDLGLAGGDLRAAERTFQLLYQVAGRAGRAERPGRVLVQTLMPEHPVMQALASGNRDAFIAAETDSRRQAEMPPHGRLVALIVSGVDERAVDDAARSLGRAAPHGDGILVLGPAPAPFALLRGRHRRRLLLKTRKDVNVQRILHGWIGSVEIPRNLRVQVDVDPYSFL